MKCTICNDTGWVCENHHNKPWGGISNDASACECGAGMPCLVCNPCDKDNPPRDPDGFIVKFDKQGYQNNVVALTPKEKDDE